MKVDFFCFVFSQKFCSSLKARGTNQVFIPIYRSQPDFYNDFISTETLLPFKKGPFHVAIGAQCPIQPIVVSRYTFLDSKRKFFGRGHAIITIMPEVPTKGMGKDDIDSLVANVQNMMQEKFEKVSDESAAAANMKYY